MGEKEIAFLYISIDAKEDAWEKAITDLGIEGSRNIRANRAHRPGKSEKWTRAGRSCRSW